MGDQKRKDKVTETEGIRKILGALISLRNVSLCTVAGVGLGVLTLSLGTALYTREITLSSLVLAVVGCGILLLK